MGPVAGGRLGAPSPVIQGLLDNKYVSSAETALRFVLANDNVDIALSGMSNIQMLEENAAIASIEGHLTATELGHVNAMMEENKKLEQLYCTGCDYCLPCPQEIHIPQIFDIMNSHRVYSLTDYAKSSYANLIAGKSWPKSADASKCIECGVCETKCPQKLPIIRQLKDTHCTLA